MMTVSDIISRQSAIEAIEAELDEAWTESEANYNRGMETARSIVAALPSAEAVEDWIPVKYREITEDERKENGYPKDWVYFLDCEMPSDDQEILVQARNGTIRWDVCYEDDGYSLDSGWDWKDDIVAWMPLPEPYREDGEA